MIIQLLLLGFNFNYIISLVLQSTLFHSAVSIVSIPDAPHSKAEPWLVVKQADKRVAQSWPNTKFYAFFNLVRLLKFNQLTEKVNKLVWQIIRAECLHFVSFYCVDYLSYVIRVELSLLPVVLLSSLMSYNNKEISINYPYLHIEETEWYKNSSA